MFKQFKNSKRIFSWFLLLLVVFNLSFFFWQNKDSYTKKYDVSYWDGVYSVSQWATPYPEKFINDAELYAIAGSSYIRGSDPVDINPEHPPLAKYLIGLSIVLFENENVMSFILGTLALVVIFFLGKKIFSSSLFAWLLVALFSFEPLFKEQLETSMLDLYQMVFALLAIIFFLKLKENRWYYLLTLISLGCVLATKTPISGLILLGVFIIYLLFNRGFNELVFFTASLPLTFLTYISTYAVHFFYNMNPSFFIRHQQFLFRWQTGENFSITQAQQRLFTSWDRLWRMLFTGWWRAWWEGPSFIRVETWTVVWPFLTLCSFLSIVFYWRNKKKEIFLIILWVFSYLLFLNSVAVFPRYLLFIFPGLYILSLFVLREIVKVFVTSKLVTKVKK